MLTFVSNSSSVIEQKAMSTTQDITTKLSAKKNNMKGWFSSFRYDITNICCCDISPKVAKCLESSGLITGIVIVLMLFIIPIISHYVLVSE